ncbi:MAG: cyclase family protein [Negativicutes bacterium]|nr:cyclase family protein [Negativicutes bacterium]
MPEIIDLTLPVKKHWRWMFSRTVDRDYTSGGPLREEVLYMTVHSFTHIDPPSHAYAGQKTIDQVPLADLIGVARVLDLSHKEPNTEITGDDLERTGKQVGRDDIVIIKTCQGRKQSLETPEFWTTSPFAGESAGRWLVERGIKAAAFDFPQDYSLRRFFLGDIPTLDEMIVHKMLLGAGIIQIEYITNTHLLSEDSVQFFAIPLRLEGASGSPARVFVIR